MNTRILNSIMWSEAIFLAFVYALFLLLVTAPVGFIISAYKVYRFKRLAERSDWPFNQSLANDEIMVATHYEWLVRTFIITFVVAMAAIGLAYYMVGFIIGGLTLIWWFYRIIRGIVALIAYRMMPASICTHAMCYGQVAS